MNHLRLEIDHLQSDADKIDLRDVAFLKPDRVDIEDAPEPVSILFSKGQTPLSQLNAVIRVLDGKAQLAHGIFERRFRRLAVIGRALNSIAAFPGQLEKLLDLAEQCGAVRDRPPLRKGTHRSDRGHWIREKRRRDLLALTMLNAELCDENV